MCHSFLKIIKVPKTISVVQKGKKKSNNNYGKDESNVYKMMMIMVMEILLIKTLIMEIIIMEIMKILL